VHESPPLPEGAKAYLAAFDAHVQAWAYGSDKEYLLTRAVMLNRLGDMGLVPRRRNGRCAHGIRSAPRELPRAA
jgi:hypothetical protein